MEEQLLTNEPLDVCVTGEVVPMREIARVLLLPALLATVFSACAAGVAAFLLRDNPLTLGMMLGLLLSLLVILLFQATRYHAQSHQPRQGDRVTYEAYEDRLRVTVEKENAELVRYTFRRDEIKNVRKTKTGRVFIARNVLVDIPEALLAEHPVLASFFPIDPNAVKSGRRQTILRIGLLASLLLYIVSIQFGMPFENAALRITACAVLAALLIGFAVFAFLQKKYVKLFWLYAVLALLLSFGVGYFGCSAELQRFAREQAATQENGAAYEEIVAEAAKAGVTLPKYTTDFEAWPYDEQYPDDVGAWMAYTVRSAQTIEDQIAADPHWLSDFPTVLESALPVSNHGDATLLLNLTTGEYNTVPQSSGTYTFLCLTWYRADRELVVGRWSIDWVA